jgi:ubiquinone biosynthesis monooxygenase Coq7
MNLDRLIIPLDRALRTLFAPASSARAIPGTHLDQEALTPSQRKLSASFMRVNHTGEVCAQALYEGQMLAARDEPIRKLLGDAAREETEHLAWTETRLTELGGRKSVLDPLFYAGSFALGAAAGLIGDRWSLGFLAETERQVERHLEGHLERLPEGDRKSRAILSQMQADEAGHAVSARLHGGGELPVPVRGAMRVASRIMTGTSRWI